MHPGDIRGHCMGGKLFPADSGEIPASVSCIVCTEAGKGMAQPPVPFSGVLSPEARSKLQQIETAFIYGEFRKALWISYDHLRSISEPIDSSFTTDLPDLPSYVEQNGAQSGTKLHLLAHSCPGPAYCDCEQFLSLTAQFLNKLRYSSVFVEAFIRQFYGVEPLPLLCVGLLAGLWINKGRLKEAQQLVEDCSAAAKFEEDSADEAGAGVGLGAWDPMDVKKYLHLVALQVTHVLLPQGMVQEARHWLKERQHHPRAVFPLEPTLVYNLKQMIDHHEELNRSSNEQFARAQSQAVSGTDTVAHARRESPSHSAESTSPALQVPPPASWSAVYEKAKMKLVRHRKGVAAGVLLFLALVIARAVYRRRKTTIYPAARRFWHELMELLDSAFSVNFGFSRIRRRQRRQEILGHADL